MRLLLCLARHAGEVVSIDELLNQVWPDVTVTADSVYQAVASLRRTLGDDPRQPTYIATIPRLGYRMVAPVTCSSEESVAKMDPSPSNSEHLSTTYRGQEAPTHDPRRVPGFRWMAVAPLCATVVVALAFIMHGRLPSDPPISASKTEQARKSIAVLPFLDLTEGMREETFADGITEEVIDRLSRIPGLRVPPPTSSFYFKGKQVPIAEIARTLGVAYVLDGSLRKSGTWVRVDVRLIRADSGYVIWSETYDQPMSNILKIQDNIAGKVASALKASIEGSAGPR